MPPFGRRRMGGVGRPRRRFGRGEPLPEPDDEFDFSDDDEDDPDDDDAGDLSAAADAFSARTGVRLHARIADDDEEDAAEQEAKGPVDAPLALRALPVIERTVLHYPEAVRGNLLRHLHLYGRFQMRGIPFLGCARPNAARVNLAVRRRTPMASLQRTLHHEIGHLVEMHPSFPEAAWLALNTTAYSGRGHRDRAGKHAGPEVWRDGFITAYASKNRHEDFAELAELAFTEPRRALNAAQASRVLAAKLDLMARVYDRMAPGVVLPWTRGG